VGLTGAESPINYGDVKNISLKDYFKVLSAYPTDQTMYAFKTGFKDSIKFPWHKGDMDEKQLLTYLRLRDFLEDPDPRLREMVFSRPTGTTYPDPQFPNPLTISQVFKALPHEIVSDWLKHHAIIPGR